MTTKRDTKSEKYVETNRDTKSKRYVYRCKRDAEPKYKGYEEKKVQGRRQYKVE